MKYLLILLLTSCAQSPVIPKVVNVPVTVNCIKDYPAEPNLTDSEALKAMNNADYVLQITADYLKLKSYADMLRASTSGCK